jgi:hypothetical protein
VWGGGGEKGEKGADKVVTHASGNADSLTSVHVHWHEQRLGQQRTQLIRRGFHGRSVSGAEGGTEDKCGIHMWRVTFRRKVEGGAMGRQLARDGSGGGSSGHSSGRGVMGCRGGMDGTISGGRHGIPPS